MWKYSKVIDSILATFVICGSLTLVAAVFLEGINGPVA